MDKILQRINLVLVLLLSGFSLAFAQTDEPDPALPPGISVEDPVQQDVDVPPGQEVGINEDNYRQFMELKDPLQQREILPEDAYKPQSGLQKLDDLPEASQRHLRDQLREIIVQGDQWQPGDEEIDYPYVPSELAGNSPPLQKQEAEAWGELLANYHAREAQIFENSTRSQSAAGSAGMQGGKPGSGDTSANDGSEKADTAEQSAQDGGAEQNSGMDSYSPKDTNDPNAVSKAGVSQNALDYLQNNGNSGSVDDTLSIEDLRNAEGILLSPVPDVSKTDAENADDSEDDIPDSGSK